MQIFLISLHLKIQSVELPDLVSCEKERKSANWIAKNDLYPEELVFW